VKLFSLPSRNVLHRLFSLAWPIIGLNVLNVFTLAVDTAMCGRLPHREIALTALGYSTQIVFLLMVAMIGLTVGTVALVSRSHGADDTKRINHILQQSVMFTVILGVMIAILGNLVAGPILSLLGASAEIRAEGLLYLRPMLIGTVFYYLNFLFAAILRGVGNTRLPFVIALITNILNIFLNYCLILGNCGLPSLGLRGAAIGTISSYIAGVLLMFWLLRRGSIPKLSMPIALRPIDRSLAWNLLRIGAPAALDMVIINASFLSIIGMLGHINSIAVAAHGIGLRIQALAFVPGMSVAQATGVLVGQALGANRPDDARKVVHASLFLCVMIMASLAMLIGLMVYPIVHIFDVAAGSQLEHFSVMWIRLLGCALPIVGIYIAFMGMLQGAGSTKTSLKINFLSTVLCQIPLSAILGFTLGLGVFGVWLAFPIVQLLRASLGAIVYRRGEWARTGITV
jgi:putative MATE family efflux protein